MSQEQQKRQLLMLRPGLDNLPAIRVAPGYAARTYQPGDDAVWADVINRSFGGKPRTPEDARNAIMSQPVFEPDRLFFVTRDGQGVGTACAWYKNEFPADTGYLHMVAVAPEHQGHGLGGLLVALVLDCFKRKGYRKVVLHTDDFRLPAIRSYLRAGFEPVYRDQDDRDRWAAILEKIKTM